MDIVFWVWTADYITRESSCLSRASRKEARKMHCVLRLLALTLSINLRRPKKDVRPNQPNSYFDYQVKFRLVI